MIENKSEMFIAIFIIAIIAGTAFIYSQTHEKNTIGIFPEKMGDMSLTLYKEGDVAIEQIKELHGGTPRKIENAYVVDYNGNSSNKAKFWVSESANHEDAVSLVTAMSKMVGTSGMFSNSTPMNIEGITVYFVSGHMEHIGLYHYFYAKDNKVFWIQIDNADKLYRINFVKESIKKI